MVHLDNKLFNLKFHIAKRKYKRILYHNNINGIIDIKFNILTVKI